jgi:hypothetical protein
MAWVVALGALGVGLWAVERIDSALFLREMAADNGLKSTRSTVDSSFYEVRNGVAAADLLARARQIAWQVVEEVHRRVPADKSLLPGVKRLRSAVPSASAIRVMELGPTPDKLIAFNWKKGDAIALCLTDGSGADGSLVGVETVVFVLLHEVAHTMTSGYDPLVGGRTQHSPEFYKYEGYMYQVAADMGLVNPKAQDGQGVCGTRIKHPHPDTLPTA